MDFIFNSTADVAVLFTLIGLSMFGQGISAAIAFLGQMRTPDWYKSCVKHIKGLAPMWVFFTLTFAVYIGMVAGYYMLYRSVALTGLFGEAIDIISLTLLFDTFMALVWIACFFGFHRPGFAMADIVLQWVTAVILMYFTWQNSYTVAFGFTLVRAVWFLYPFYINAYMLYEMYYHGRFPKGSKCSSKRSKHTDSDDVSNV